MSRLAKWWLYKISYGRPDHGDVIFATIFGFLAIVVMLLALALVTAISIATHGWFLLISGIVFGILWIMYKSMKPYAER